MSLVLCCHTSFEQSQTKSCVFTSIIVRCEQLSTVAGLWQVEEPQTKNTKTACSKQCNLLSSTIPSNCYMRWFSLLVCYWNCLGIKTRDITRGRAGLLFRKETMEVGTTEPIRISSQLIMLRRGTRCVIFIQIASVVKEYIDCPVSCTSLLVNVIPSGLPY